MSTSPNPFVSCLCSSRPCRWGSLQRAILDFNAQVYANRELVIAADLSTDYPSMIQSFVDSLALTAAVRVLPRTVKCQIDGLHQAAIAAYGVPSRALTRRACAAPGKPPSRAKA